MLKLVRQRNFIYGALVTTSALAIAAGLAMLLQNTAVAQQTMVDVPMF
jgi:hypothetical protein